MTTEHPPHADAQRHMQMRNAVHWTAQVLAATQDALLTHAADDSHAALSWDPCRGIAGQPLPDGSQLTLRLVEPAILHLAGGQVASSFSLDGQSLSAAFDWVNQAVPGLGASRQASPRNYDMPAHPFGVSGARFQNDPDALAQLTQALGDAHQTLQRFASDQPHTTALWLWPHHFDLGLLWLPSPAADPQKDPSLGLGFSLGDAAIQHPYYYANPYGITDAPLASLALGEDAPSWRGHVLR
ncbi:MAG: DUF5996 family protein, partial [Planctomycetota bacterium]